MQEKMFSKRINILILFMFLSNIIVAQRHLERHYIGIQSEDDSKFLRLGKVCYVPNAKTVEIRKYIKKKNNTVPTTEPTEQTIFLFMGAKFLFHQGKFKYSPDSLLENIILHTKDKIWII